ncbi:hypothetical protein J4219_04725 [Candidatus Woesearchaeota archaeon]|nr:hypothetical protein [Candidatus Woesearchaeota archaeon]
MGLYKYRFNVFERIKSVKDILQPVCPDKDSFTVRGLVMRCVKYRARLINKLNQDESRAYELLLKNKLNPKTVYTWLLLEDSPPELRQKLEQNKISIIDARHEYVRWKRQSGTNSAQELMEEMRTVIGRLKWKSHESLHNLQ